jgi:hypothetical protein
MKVGKKTDKEIYLETCAKHPNSPAPALALALALTL